MKSAGFTMVEIILSMVLIGITVGVTAVLMGRGIDAYQLVSTRTDALDTARFALVRMQKEMTRVSLIRNAQPDRFVYQDPLSGNDIDFRLEGTILYQHQSPLARNVTSLLFTYYRDNGSTTNAAPQVRRIHIDLAVAGGTGSDVTLRTDVFPRTFLYENFQ